LSSLNHFTVPVAIADTSIAFVLRTRRMLRQQRQRALALGRRATARLEHLGR
jgi:hypothetical protein